MVRQEKLIQRYGKNIKDNTMKSEHIIAELDDVVEKLKMKIVFLETEIATLKKRIALMKETIRKV